MAHTVLRLPAEPEQRSAGPGDDDNDNEEDASQWLVKTWVKGS